MLGHTESADDHSSSPKGLDGLQPVPLRIEPERRQRWWTQLVAWLDKLSMLGFVSAGGALVLAVGLTLATGYAFATRNAVWLTVEPAARAMELRAALSGVALGASSDLEMDCNLSIGQDPPVEVVLPGVGVSLMTLVGAVRHVWILRPPSIRVLVIEPAKDRYQAVVIVETRGGGARTFQGDPKASIDASLVEAAEFGQEALRPIGLASYLYRRDPVRARRVIQAIVSAPDQPPADVAAAYRLLGLLLLDEGDYDGARAVLKATIKRSVRPPRYTPDWWWSWIHRPSGREIATAYVALGHVGLWQGHWDEAARAYAHAARRAPEWPVPYRLWGDALQGRGDFERALRQYNEAVARGDSSPAPPLARAHVLRLVGRYEESIASAMEARRAYVGLDPAGAGIDVEWANALMAAGRYNEAFDKYDRAVALDPTLRDARSMRAGARACWPFRVPAAGDASSPPWLDDAIALPGLGACPGDRPPLPS